VTTTGPSSLAFKYSFSCALISAIDAVLIRVAQPVITLVAGGAVDRCPA
jgi:hypothetical protein